MESSREDSRVGEVVAGRYQLGRVLGRGGHGVVFQATELSAKRDVALKMLLPDAVQEHGSVERFVREAALAKKLSHPNTIQLVDFGQTEEGLPFIVWELLRGHTLAEEIAKGALSVERTARIAAQVLRSLTEAHALGIVHRDIKPENVYLMERDGQRDFVKLLDFGVARPMVGGDASRKITRYGQMIGTPSYMAPELVKGGGELGPATDLYALGLVMAESLSGTCIVQGDSAIRVWTWQASDEPVPLPDVVRDSALGAVIERATRKPLGERYASCADMLADVDRVLAALERPRAPVSAPARPSRRERQRTTRLEGAPAWPSASTTQMMSPSVPPPPMVSASPSVVPPSMAPPAFSVAPPVVAAAPRPRRTGLWVLVVLAVIVLVAASAVAAMALLRKPRQTP